LPLVAASPGAAEELEHKAVAYDVMKAAGCGYFLRVDPAKYEFQSEFAKRYLAEGRAEGRAELVLELIGKRFGPLNDEVRERVRGGSAEELDRIIDHLLSAQSLDELLG